MKFDVSFSSEISVRKFQSSSSFHVPELK